MSLSILILLICLKTSSTSTSNIITPVSTNNYNDAYEAMKIVNKAYKSSK